ncbi:MAG: hypothetical protein AAFU85_27175 [Planctomycetota bacterium]
MHRTLIPQPKRGTPRRSISDRLGGLFASMTQLARQEEQQRVATYSELVQQLAACEVDDKATMPEAGDVHSICSEAGKTTEDLEVDVARTVEVIRLRAELAIESDVEEQLDSVRLQFKGHQAKFEQMVASMQAQGDQLKAEQTRLEDAVRRRGHKVQRLEQLAGQTCDRSAEIAEQISALRYQEAELQARYGGVPEKYITGKAKLESTEALKVIGAEIDEIESTFNDQSTAKQHGLRIRLTFLRRQRDEHEKGARLEERGMQRGAEVRRVRDQIAALAAEKGQLDSARKAELVG